MPIIRPSGLLSGERIAQLSDTAKLYWPFLYAASNGYGRFELDYHKILESAFRQFQQKPTQDEVGALIREYRDKHLLFIYKANGRLWCAWDDAAHQQYFNAKDKASPEPPEPAFSEWRNQYRANKESRSGQLTELEKEFESESRECSIGFNNESISNEYRLDNESITNLHNTDSITQLSTQLNTEHRNTNAPARAKAIEMPVAMVRAMGWDETIEAALRAGMAIDPSTDSPFFREVWAPSPISDKADCVRGIYARIDCGQFGPSVEAQYIPAFRNFYVARAWNETLRPRNRGQPHGKKKAAVMEEFDRFVMRDLEDAKQ